MKPIDALYVGVAIAALWYVRRAAKIGEDIVAATGEHLADVGTAAGKVAAAVSEKLVPEPVQKAAAIGTISAGEAAGVVEPGTLQKALDRTEEAEGALACRAGEIRFPSNYKPAPWEIEEACKNYNCGPDCYTPPSVWELFTAGFNN